MLFHRLQVRIAASRPLSSRRQRERRERVGAPHCSPARFPAPAAQPHPFHKGSSASKSPIIETEIRREEGKGRTHTLPTHLCALISFGEIFSIAFYILVVAALAFRAASVPAPPLAFYLRQQYNFPAKNAAFIAQSSTDTRRRRMRKRAARFAAKRVER